MNIETALKTALKVYIFFACLREIHKHKRPTPCDSCKHLRQRRSSAWYGWKYECHRYGHFDEAPTYCSDYKPMQNEVEERTESLVECRNCSFFEPLESVQGMYGICHKHVNICKQNFYCNAGERIDEHSKNGGVE